MNSRLRQRVQFREEAMASDSIFESFPSYPECFMRGEYRAGLLVSACVQLCAHSKGAEGRLGARLCRGGGGLVPEAGDCNAIELPTPPRAAPPNCFYAYLVKLVKCWVRGRRQRGSSGCSGLKSWRSERLHKAPPGFMRAVPCRQWNNRV